MSGCLFIIINGKNELGLFNKSCKNVNMSFSVGKKAWGLFHISPPLAANDNPNSSVIESV